MYHPDRGAKDIAAEILQFAEMRAQRGKGNNSTEEDKAAARQLGSLRNLYHALLSGWARCGDADAFQETIKLFNVMNVSTDESSVPVTRSYNWVIFAAGSSPTLSQEDAHNKFNVVMELFTELHNVEHIQPDSLTYSNFLFVCKALLPKGPGQDAIVENTIQMCKHNGLVDSVVFHNLSRYFPKILKKLVENEEGLTSIGNKLPTSWDAKVDPSKRWPAKQQEQQQQRRQRKGK